MSKGERTIEAGIESSACSNDERRPSQHSTLSSLFLKTVLLARQARRRPREGHRPRRLDRGLRPALREEGGSKARRNDSSSPRPSPSRRRRRLFREPRGRRGRRRARGRLRCRRRRRISGRPRRRGRPLARCGSRPLPEGRGGPVATQGRSRRRGRACGAARQLRSFELGLDLLFVVALPFSAASRDAACRGDDGPR